jgi:hypothetical protein
MREMLSEATLIGCWTNGERLSPLQFPILPSRTKLDGMHALKRTPSIAPVRTVALDIPFKRTFRKADLVRP